MHWLSVGVKVVFGKRSSPQCHTMGSPASLAVPVLLSCLLMLHKQDFFFVQGFVFRANTAQTWSSASAIDPGDGDWLKCHHRCCILVPVLSMTFPKSHMNWCWMVPIDRHTLCVRAPLSPSHFLLFHSHSQNHFIGLC